MTRNEKLKDIKEHPEKHQHTFEQLQVCCTIKNAIDLELMDAHVGITGPNRNCDVTNGPCACGAWH